AGADQHLVDHEAAPHGALRPHDLDDLGARHLQLVVAAEDVLHRLVLGHQEAHVAAGEPGMLPARGVDEPHRVAGGLRRLDGRLGTLEAMAGLPRGARPRGRRHASAAARARAAASSSSPASPLPPIPPTTTPSTTMGTPPCDGVREPNASNEVAPPCSMSSKT